MAGANRWGASCRGEGDEQGGGNAYLRVIGEGFDLQINPGLVIHNFPMPIKIGTLGNQGVNVLASLLENTKLNSQARHLICSTYSWLSPPMPKLWSHYAREQV